MMELFMRNRGLMFQTLASWDRGERMNEYYSCFHHHIRTPLRGWAVIGMIMCVVSLAAATNAARPDSPAQSTLDADKLPPGWFTGTVVSVPNTDRMCTLNVAYQKLQLKPGQNLARANQGLQLQYNRILRLQNQLMRPPSRGQNPMQTMQQLQNAMMQFQIQLARTEANMFQVVNAAQKVDFQVEENVKVRIKTLPEPFDEKGNIKKYSGEELAALKGKDKYLPGYESSIENLKPGQIVQVKLSQHKKPRQTSTSGKDDAKETKKEKHAAGEKRKDASTEHKNQVGLIVILKDNDAEPSATTPVKSRNNK